MSTDGLLGVCNGRMTAQGARLTLRGSDLVLAEDAGAHRNFVLLTEKELWVLLEGRGIQSWDDVAQLYEQPGDKQVASHSVAATTDREQRPGDLQAVLKLGLETASGHSPAADPTLDARIAIVGRMLQVCCGEIRKNKEGGAPARAGAGASFLSHVADIAAGAMRYLQNARGVVGEDALNCLSFAYLMRREYEEVLACVRLLAKSKDKEFRIMAYCRGGDVYFAQKNYQNAALYYWKAVGIDGGGNDSKMHAYAVKKLVEISSHEDVSLHIEEATYEGISDADDVRLTEEEYRAYVAEKHREPAASASNPRGMDPQKRLRIVSLPCNPLPLYNFYNSSNGVTPNNYLVPLPYNMPRNLSWLVPGVLMGSSTPRNALDIALLKHLFNLSHVVTVTKEEPLESGWFPEGGGVENLFLPVQNYEPPSVEQVDTFLELMKARKGPVLAHCGGGKGRAGCFLAAYLLRFGCKAPPSDFDNISNKNKSIQPGTLDRDKEEEEEEEGQKQEEEPQEDAFSTNAPAMNAEEAVALIRSMRPGSLETEQQEKFVRKYSHIIWSRLQRAKTCAPVLTSREPLAWNADEAPPCTRGSSYSPSVIICSGLPCSGKSWFASQLSLHGGYVRVCQDECEGSRDKCEAAFSLAAAGKMNPRGGAQEQNLKLILDRCNPTREDRMRFLGLAFKPADALSVHFAASPNMCKNRLRERKGHPTLSGGDEAKGDRVIDSFAKSMTIPRKQEGFAFSCSVPSFRAARDLLQILGVQASDVDEQAQWRQVVNGVDKENTSGRDKEPTLTNENKSAMKYDSGEVRKDERSAMIKFPRTRHLLDLGGSGVTRDDLLMDDQDLSRFLEINNNDDNSNSSTRVVTIEEKVDGANMGFSYAPDTHSIVAQNRSHYVNAKSHAQFAKLGMWLERHREELFALCADESENDSGSLLRSRILYGEWCYAKHSIPYDMLPDFFIAFDIYDIKRGKFYSRARFHAMMDERAPSMARIPTVAGAGAGDDELGNLKATCLNLKSAFRSGQQDAEGVYMRIDEGGWLLERAKIVRPDFICGDAHWSKHNLTKNLIDHRAQSFG